MNILYLCDEYPPGVCGGIGIATQSIARSLVKKGHNVVVAGFYDRDYGEKNEFTDNGVKVYRFRRLLSGRFFPGTGMPSRIFTYVLKRTGILGMDVSCSLKKYHA